MRRATIALVALGLLSSCGSRVRDWPGNDMTQGVTTTAPGRGSGNGDSAVTTTPLRSSTTRRSGTASGTGTTAPATASPLPHPQPGVYTYDVTVDEPALDGDPPTHDTDVFHERWTVSDDKGALRLESADADAEDRGSSTTYRVTSKTLEYVSDSYRDEDGTYLCAYKPAQTVLQLPLRVGDRWHTDSTCTYEDGEVDRIVYDSRVTGTATDTIAGHAVTTFVVEWMDTTTESYPADPDTDEDASTDTYRTQHTVHVDPATLLIVSEVLKDLGADGTASTFTRQLRSLSPRSI